MISYAFRATTFLMLSLGYARTRDPNRTNFYTVWSHQLNVARQNVQHSTLRSEANRLHMIRYENGCVDRGDGHKADFNGQLHISLVDGDRRRLKAGQWVLPTQANNYSRADRWVNMPSLLLTGPRSNPNHQLWDILFSLFPAGNLDSLPFVQWMTPYAQCNYWMCDKVDYLFDALGHPDAVQYNALIIDKGPICFKEVWVPNFAMYRNEFKVPSNYANALLAFRSRLTQDFVSPTDCILIYGRADARYRHWANAASVSQTLIKTSGKNVNYVSQMGTMTPSTQCRTYWDARIILIPHGGHAGNLICARPGTKVLEISCAKNIGWFQNAKHFHSAMGLSYRYIRIPYSNCSVTQEPKKDWSFTTPEAWTPKFINA